ncbi:MAG TPA: protease inhibitor I42 family protein [Nitrospiraceae bacterium]|nr:protease inhibitor I42 family protein [Nitrospiraceae bacterium]
MNQGGRSQQSAAGDREVGATTLSGKVGMPLRIHLWEDRTRGELWVPTYDPKALPLVDDDFLRIASGNAVDTGRRTFEFQPVMPGTHRVVFEKRMGWKFTAEDRHVFYVDVH